MIKETYLEGDTRVINKFIWLPTKFDGFNVWLEKVYLSQRYMRILGVYKWVTLGLCDEKGHPLYLSEHTRFKNK